MSEPAVEQFAQDLGSPVKGAIHKASALKISSRKKALKEFLEDSEAAREYAANVKAYVLDNLKELLVQFETKCIESGIQVHWAKDAGAANAVITDLCQRYSPGVAVVKAKSMATEEIHLNDHLVASGIEPIETDLGEFVAQLDHDLPSHIVTPIIHKSRDDVAKIFAREGLGPYTTDPEELALQARTRLREVFKSARVGISGVNFGVVESGRLVLVENEGNNRLSTTAPEVHVALMGIEKILPRDSDLPMFLRLLAGSSTGQQLTVYTHFIRGPRRPDERDGPNEVHLILLDNGRSKVLNGPYRDILRCIRCGACLNVCPVYRQASGHAYKHVYSGPLGAVLAPALEGIDQHKDLPFASSLCGACEEVCPVKIPIPDLLLSLRHEAQRARLAKNLAPWKMFAFGSGSAFRWSVGLTLLPLARHLPHPALRGWTVERELPSKIGRDFRGWWHDRS